MKMLIFISTFQKCHFFKERQGKVVSSTEQLDIIQSLLVEQAEQIIQLNWQVAIFQLPFPYLLWEWEYFVFQLYCRRQKAGIKNTITIWDGSKKFFSQCFENRELNPNTQELVLSDWISDPLMSKMTRTFRNITQLTISRQTMGVKGARLVYMADWKQISRLQFTDNCIGDEGAKILSKCQWDELQELYLDRNKLNNKGFCNLLKSNWPKLKRLSLQQSNFTPDMARAIPKHSWPSLEKIYFQEADQSEFTKALVKIVPHINFNGYFSIKYACSRREGSFAVFEHSVTSHCLAKTMNANTRFVLGHYSIYQDVAFVSKGIMNIKEGGFLGFYNR